MFHIKHATVAVNPRCEGTVLFAANLSMLWADLPLAQRFERASGVGFAAVELWWPGDADAETLPGLVARWNLRLVLLNFDAGDMAAGERGLAGDPSRRDALRAHVPHALKIASACRCPRLNLLLGLRQAQYSLPEQMECARDNVAWAADLSAHAGCEVMIEAINPVDNGPVLLSTTEAAAAFIHRVGRPNVRLQYDVYHMQRTEGDLVTTLDAYWDRIGHIQVADVPGRHEPGTGEINYAFVLDHLARRGYQGAVGLEYRPSTPRPEDSLAWLERWRVQR
jgi:hydroxypyruvate isomerase